MLRGRRQQHRSTPAWQPLDCSSRAGRTVPNLLLKSVHFSQASTCFPFLLRLEPRTIFFCFFKAYSCFFIKYLQGRAVLLIQSARQHKVTQSWQLTNKEQSTNSKCLFKISSGQCKNLKIYPRQ